jgi:signal peptidase I
MTSDSMLITSFCRLYSMLLYAYPAEFRREYGRPMEQLFRDRCCELARRSGQRTVLRFAAHIVSDWLRTTVRERSAAIWSAGRTSGKRSSVTEWAGTILIYLFATTTMVQAYVIPTGSMEGNLLVGDHILVDRTAFAEPGPLGRHILPYRQIERGDIIAFIYPEDVRQTYVKRVIGLPGDRIHLENGQVIRNGRRLIEPYTQHIATYPDRYRDNFPIAPDIATTPRGREMFAHHVRNGEVIVPPGMIFAMGDNRENSADSRTWGFVPRSYVVGKPLLVYWSYDAPTADLQEWTLNHVIDVAQHFFTRTRWKRAFLIPRSHRAEEETGGVL